MRSKIILFVYLLLLLSGCKRQASAESPVLSQTAAIYTMDIVMNPTVYRDETILKKAESRIYEKGNYTYVSVNHQPKLLL